MTNGDALKWLENLRQDIGKSQHSELWHYEQALSEIEELLSMNVDSFVQWCIDNHIVGDATVQGIKYWVGKFKEGR